MSGRQDIEIAFSGLSFTALGRDLAGREFRLPVRSSLVGEYNVYNCLAALTLALGVMRLPPESVSAGLAAMRSVPGRMELIQMGQSFTAIVDFAHTPNALIKSLEAARQLTSGRVIAVFGSAGLRDREKRRMMAEASAGLADVSILTAEDPRTESLNGILDEMADGARSRGGVEGQTFWRVPDRREALRLAVRLARPGDLLIACGKGHEQSMCFGETEYAWDDRVALRAALAESLGLPGPEMPYLPDDRLTGELIFQVFTDRRKSVQYPGRHGTDLDEVFDPAGDDHQLTRPDGAGFSAQLELQLAFQYKRALFVWVTMPGQDGVGVQFHQG